MIAGVAQRWRDRAGSYRPAGEPIQPGAYEVAEIAGDKEAKAFVQRHHYSGSYPSARARFGLYKGAALVGVAVFSHPCNNAVLSVLPGEPTSSMELGRLVLLDEVPSNGESWFVARCFELLRRRGLVGVVSFSDPEPRTDLAGTTRFIGHVGTIYQALNATYYGRTRAETRALLPDGTIFHARAIAKVRAGDRGRDYAAAILERHGAAPLGAGDPDAWLATWLPRLTRPLKHRGNYRYVWALDRAARRHLPAPLPYPKLFHSSNWNQCRLVWS